MSLRFLSLFFVFLIGCQSLAVSSSAIAVDAEAFNGSAEAFEGHESYLSMSLPYEPVRKVLVQLETQVGRSLKNRREAHVTVLTPPELKRIERWVSIHDINRIALENSVQSSDLKPICLGRGEAVVRGSKKEQTYFIVVESENLLLIRHKIAELYRARGGEEGRFDPHHFFPHITVGFTDDDLHESQGVIKDARSCVSDISLASL